MKLNYTIAPAYVQYNGVAYLVLYTISASDGSSVTALKRIVVSSKGAKNNNPTIGSVSSNGAALSAFPGTNAFTNAVLTLAPSFSAGAESYQVMQPDGSLVGQTETLVNTWFYSDGSTQFDRTIAGDSDEWTTPESHPSGRAAVIVLTTHDGRGGEDAKVFNFN